MKKLIFVLLFASLAFASGNAPTDQLKSPSGWETDFMDSTTYPSVIKYSDGVAGSGLDTLDGADSVLILSGLAPQGHEGWQYILSFGKLSGDSASAGVAQLIVDEIDNNDSLVTTNIVDTIAVGGNKVLLPLGATLIANKYNVYVKSVTALDEMVLGIVHLHKRRQRVIQTTK